MVDIAQTVASHRYDDDGGYHPPPPEVRAADKAVKVLRNSLTAETRAALKQAFEFDSRLIRELLAAPN